MQRVYINKCRQRLKEIQMKYENNNFTMEMGKIGKNWYVSTTVNNLPDEFFSFKTKKAAVEFFNKYIEYNK